MGVSLDYRTTAAVSQPVKDAITAESRTLSPAHNWWTEALNFFTAEDDGRLYGATKLFLIGYTTANGGYVEVDADEDSLMAYRDACFILDKLADWSQKHGLSWEIDCAGESIGTISEGQWDRNLRDYVDGTKKLFPWPADFDERVKAISTKYASRW